ncbi:MAG: MOSC domain-containing protein [Gemmatimonadota bacterium]
MHLSGLHLYPLKSGAAFSVDAVAVDALGPVGDRRWMLVGADGIPLTQREIPRLARVHALPAGDGGLELVALGMPPLAVAPPGEEAPVVRTSLWGHAAEGRAASAAASEWLGEFLETECRLLHVPRELARPVAGPWGRGSERTAFTDGFPFLLVGEGSLDALNERLASPVPMDRFRPNLVVAGTEPFEEDDWDAVRIGRVALRVVKPCPRCVVTTVDQATGVRDPAGEPLRTLARFRTRDGKAWLGVNLVHESEGELRLADPVEVLSRRGSPAG